jgi:TRAP-type mannitol/chloroaromatic compound transport system permease small subunit
MKTVERLERAIGQLGRANAWLVLVIILLMATNVVLRYAFSFGSVWAQELEWHLLSPLILIGMSYAMQSGEHVRVDILYAKFPFRRQLLVDMLSSVLTIAVCLAIIFLSVSYVEQSFSVSEASPDPGGLPLRWLLKALIPLGFAVLAVQAVLQLARQLTKWKSLEESVR